MEIAIEFIKILLPAGLVLWAMYLTVSSFLQKELVQKELDLKADYAKTLLPIRLQAYERMALFLERITPNQLLVRLNGMATSAKEFQQILLHEVREEFSHNLSQQVYMSDAAWEQVRNAKEQVITLINTAAQALTPEATAFELSKKIFEMVINQNLNLTDSALLFIKDEMRKAFF